MTINIIELMVLVVEFAVIYFAVSTWSKLIAEAVK